ncbi:hypothetical protein AB1Y20_003271 [Prymnesium parvum]|uniref:Nitroreductase domain-containing protein n=1 Tax=Prymnesium parvum TaxID=97485 RepID=A0AB34JCU5_PRYPA
MAAAAWLCLALLTPAAHAAEDADGTLLERALAATASLARRRQLTEQQELSAVQRILKSDARLLLLSKHFGGGETFGAHLRSALEWPPTSAAPPATPPPHPPPPQLCTAAPDAVLFSRRSVVAFNASEVPAAVVQRALEAAVLAPNHFLSEPWRFYLAGPRTRARLAALNEAKRHAFERVPAWLVATLRSAHEEGSKLYYEDHAAAAAALQNFMLSLAGAGVGSKWMTGALGAPAEAVLAALGVDPAAERFMGAIWFGYPEVPLDADPSRAPARKLGVAGVLTHLP